MAIAMMVVMAEPISLSTCERDELQAMSRARTIRAEDAQRADIILGLAERRQSVLETSRRQQCSANTVRLLRDRFLGKCLM